MDLRRLRAGEWIVALGGAALLASLFLPDDGETAWQAMTAGDVILAAVAAAAIGLALITATQRVPAVPIAYAATVPLAGAVALLIALLGMGGWARWLAVAASLALVYGGWRAIRDERTSKPGRHTDATGRPTPPPPEIEPIPAPRP